MQKVEESTEPNTGMKFVISCGYFNKVDEKTHTTDFIVDLIQDDRISSSVDRTLITSAA